MSSKSLPSFKHSSVGTKTHKERTATAHVSYIMRAEARTHFQAENMPDGGRGTRVFFDKLWEKAGMPENARICDKLMIALPGELAPEQRYEAVQTFMQDLGQGRIAWCAAYHEKGEDAHNPHAHIVFKDADIDTGRKVIGTTTSAKDVREAQEHGWKVPPRATTDDLRKRWCDHLNKVMERAGLDIRYDARTLKEQGIDREPQIPIGPKAQALEEKSHDFDSHDRSRGDRTIAYSLLDQMSRVQYNNQIIEANREKEAAETAKTYQSRDPLPLTPLSPLGQERHDLLKAQAATRKALYEEQKRDREALRKAQMVAKLNHKTWAKQLYAGARQAAYDEIKPQYDEKWKDLRTNTPRRDIQRWVAESRPAYTGANAGNLETWRTSHAQTTSPGLARPANRFCGEPLHELRGRLDPQRAGGQCRRLSSRPGAGLHQYDQLRSLRAQTETSAAETHSLPLATSPQAVAPSSGLADELAAAKGYYASRIAAARQTLSQTQLVLAIRAIHDEQTLAARAIIQRWEAHFQNRKQGPPEAPRRPAGNRPPLRYGELRKN